MHSPECDAKVRRFFHSRNIYCMNISFFRIFIDLNQIVVRANIHFPLFLSRSFLSAHGMILSLTFTGAGVGKRLSCSS